MRDQPLATCATACTPMLDTRRAAAAIKTFDPRTDTPDAQIQSTLPWRESGLDGSRHGPPGLATGSAGKSAVRFLAARRVGASRD